MSSDPPVESDPQPSYTLRAIQAQVGGEIAGDPDTVITGLGAIESAQPGALTFAESPAYAAQVRQNRASAVIVPRSFPALEGRTLLRVEQPRLAFIKVMYLFEPPTTSRTGIHRQALVAPDVALGRDVTIREGAVVRPRVSIGDETVIESGAFIGEDVTIGARCFIGPNVVIMHGSRIGQRVIMHGGVVIGADGFGFMWDDGRYLKIPQLGNVVIEDDVEIGANSCVDRATLGSTLVKRGTKVDNQVQIAHNDVIGEDVILSGQVGLAGSVKIGNRAILGGKAGVVDHVVLGENSRLGAATVATKDIPAGQTVWGWPAREIRRAKREMAALALLPRLLKQLQRSKRPKRRPAKS